MKIAKYAADRIAAVLGDQLIDLNLAYAGYAARKLGESRAQALADARVPCDLLEFIKAGDAGLDAARAALEFATAEGDGMRGPAGENIRFTLGSVPLRAPLPSRASKLICMGRNFASHSAKMLAQREATGVKEAVPESSLQPKRPAGFLKLPDTVMGVSK